jgi:hypothetical protein
MNYSIFQDYANLSDDHDQDSLTIPELSPRYNAASYLREDHSTLPIEYGKKDIPQLVERFLEDVHTKNPFLDVDALRKNAQRVMNHGLDWSGWTCIVVSVSSPFS